MRSTPTRLECMSAAQPWEVIHAAGNEAARIMAIAACAMQADGVDTDDVFHVIRRLADDLAVRLLDLSEELKDSPTTQPALKVVANKTARRSRKAVAK